VFCGIFCSMACVSSSHSVESTGGCALTYLDRRRVEVVPVLRDDVNLLLRRLGVHVVRLHGACRPPIAHSVSACCVAKKHRSARLGSAHPHAASARCHRAAVSVSVCGVCRRPIRVFHVAVGVLIIIRRAWPGVGHRR